MQPHLKWLLLIPAFAAVIGLGYAIPKLVGDSSASNDGSGSASAQANEVATQQIKSDQQQISAYQDLITKNPKDLLSIRKLGDTYLDMGEAQSQTGDVNNADWSYKKAIDQYRSYLVLNPSDLDVTLDLGYTYTELGMDDVALREIQLVTAAAPTNQRAWLNQGYTYLTMGNVTEAKAALQKAIDLDPKSQIGQQAQQLLDQANSGAAQSITVPSSP